MGELLVITSGKGGVGKSTIAVGLAVALSDMNKSVLLVDADEGMRCLDSLLSVSNKLVFDISDVLSGMVEISKAVHLVPGYESMYLLAAPTENDVINSLDFGSLINELSNAYDYVIVDCPAGLNNKYYLHLKKNAKFLIVTNFDNVSVKGAHETSKGLLKCGLENMFLVLNRFDKKYAAKIKLTIDDIIDNSGVKLLAIVPEDPYVKLAAAKGKPLSLGIAAKALHKMAARVEGFSVPLSKI